MPLTPNKDHTQISRCWPGPPRQWTWRFDSVLRYPFEHPKTTLGPGRGSEFGRPVRAQGGLTNGQGVYVHFPNPLAHFLWVARVVVHFARAPGSLKERNTLGGAGGQ